MIKNSDDDLKTQAIKLIQYANKNTNVHISKDQNDKVTCVFIGTFDGFLYQYTIKEVFGQDTAK